MKRIICLISVLILTVVSVLSFTSCDGRGGCNGCTRATSETEKEKYVPKIVEGKYFVKDGSSEYKIVIPKESDSQVITASSELQYFFSKATGSLLPVLTDDQAKDGDKCFSLGKTTLVKNEEEFDINGLSANSYKILSSNDNVYVLSNGNFGTLWGVYKLLYFLFGYRYYTANSYKIDTGISTLNYMDINFTDIPDIETRIGGGAETYNKKSIDVLRYKYTSMTDILCGGLHNGLEVLNPETYNRNPEPTESNENYHPKWYATSGNQLCYTAHGDSEEYQKMIDTTSEILIDKLINERPDAKYVSFMINDNWGFCACDACKESESKYGGSKSAAIIQFCNKLYEKINQYFKDNGIDRDVKVVYFVYYAYEDVPAVFENGEYKAIDDSVICKGVIPYYANLSTCVHNKDYSESENKACMELLDKLEAICDEYWVWGYCVNFSNYLAPYDYFNTIQNNFEILKDRSCSVFFLQGGWNAGVETRFGRLIEFLISEMTWDSSQNVEELTKEFFENCYGPASETMLKYYDELRIRLQYIHNVMGASNSVFLDSIMSQEYWPLSLLTGWEEMIEKAYSEIDYLKDFDSELYAKYNENIKIEGLFIRYFIASIYMTNDTEATLQYKKELISDMRDLGVLKVSEGSSVESLAIDWKIS